MLQHMVKPIHFPFSIGRVSLSPSFKMCLGTKEVHIWAKAKGLCCASALILAADKFNHAFGNTGDDLAVPQPVQKR
jgi:hypothetical protein